MATITIKQYTVQEVLEKWSSNTGVTMTQSDLARFLGMNRQQVGALKDKPIPGKYYAKIESLFNNTNNEDDIILDYYPDMFGSCGNGIFALSPVKEQLIVPKKAFFTRFSPVKKYSVINAYGNSMEPFICDRDKLIVEHYEGEQIIDNRPYIFCYKDEIFIKRLVKNINQLVIIPENKDYDIIKLAGEDLENVNIIGQIVGLMRDLR